MATKVNRDGSTTTTNGNTTTTYNKDGSRTVTVTNPGGSSVTTTYNSNGTRASQTTNPSKTSSGTSTYDYGGGSSGSSGSSGRSSSAAQPTATQTTYIDASGNRKTGYIINGTTYQDAAGTTPVGVGSVVTTADGNTYLKTANGSQLFTGTQQQYTTKDGQVLTGWNIDGRVYTDPYGTTQIPYGSIVTTADGKRYVKGAGTDVSYDLDYWKAIHNISGWGNLDASLYGGTPTQAAQPVSSAALNQNMYAQQLLQQQQQQQGSSATMQQLQSQLEQVNSLLEQSLAYNDTTYTAQLEQLKAQLQSQIDALNRQYQAMNRQLYVDYMNSRKNLPQALAAQGYTGGLTESSMIGLDTGYQGQLSENERARLAGISDLEAGGTSDALELQIAQAQADQEAYQNAYSNRAALYAQMLQQQNLEDERAAEASNNLYARQYQLAQLGANYGDYSGLSALGIDTNAATAATGDYYAQLAAKGYTDYTSAFAWLIQQGIGSTAADTIAKGYINSLGGGSGTSTAAYSGGGYDNGGLTTAQIKQMQRALGVTADGLWGPNSRAAAGGLSAAEAWKRYGSNGNYSEVLGSVLEMKNNGQSRSEIETALKSALNGGLITESQYKNLIGNMSTW